MQDKVERVLSRVRDLHPDMPRRLTSGGCYLLYVLLKEVFPEAVAHYDGDHIYIEISGKYYDIEGKHLQVPSNMIPFTEPRQIKDALTRWAER